MAWYWETQADRIERKLDRAIDLLHTVLKREDNLMSALTDLKAALAALTDSISSATAEIETLLTKISAPGTPDADVQAAVVQIQGLVTAINDEVAKAQSTAP